MMVLLNKRLVGILSVVACLLLIPFTAMLFTNAVDWTLLDFIVVGVLLLSAGLLIELVLRKVTDPTWRIVFCAIVMAGFLLVWAELAVGIFGTPFAGT